jgi:hypothetical protein
VPPPAAARCREEGKAAVKAAGVAARYAIDDRPKDGR